MSTTELFSLQGRTAIVTGATGLLGREHCRALAEAGARVVATDLDAAACDTLAAEIGGGAFGQRADVTDPGVPRNPAGGGALDHGRVDVLVNNAALNDSSRTRPPRWNRRASSATRSTLGTGPRGQRDRGLSLLTGDRHAHGRGRARQHRQHRLDLRRRGPRSIALSRPRGPPAFCKSAAYPTSKGAVLAFTRFLAAYWGASGVRVNALSPGGVENGQDDFFVADTAAARRSAAWRRPRTIEARSCSWPATPPPT